jgi:PAS domain S-box-containing protein
MLQTRIYYLLLIWGLAIATLLANAGLTLYNVSSLVEEERWVAHTHEVRERLSAILANIVDIETSVRGYVITRQPEFLEPAKQAEQAFALRLAQLKDKTSDNEDQQQAIAKLERLHDVHQAFVDEVVAAIRTESPDKAAELIRSDRGKDAMDAVRAEVGSMLAHENQLLSDRVVNANAEYSSTAASAILGAALSLAMTVAAFIVVWQELRRRRIAEVAVTVQAETARLAAERFRLLTETVPTLIWTSSADGKPTFFNRSWRTYTGVNGAVENKGAMDAWTAPIHPDDAPRLRAAWSIRNGDAPPPEELRVLRESDGEYRWHQCAVVPVRAQGGAIESWVGTLTDIQDRKEQAETLERAIQVRTKELRTANQALHDEVGERVRAEECVKSSAIELRRSNEELEKFAYVASHDLQEPLRKIQAFGDRLLRKNRDALDEQGRDYLDRMLASATRMRTLINDLLAFSRVATQNRPFVPVDLNEVLAGVLEDLEDRLAESHGKVESARLPIVHADPVQFRQLFQNLIGNALKFKKPGQPPLVTIALAPMSDIPDDADPPPLPGRTGWRLVFADNGIGFEQQHEQRIFELFQRLHGRHEYEGTGLGLAICRKIVERHGGAICARSRPGEGTRFFVDLLEVPPEAPLGMPPAGTPMTHDSRTTKAE